MISERGGDAGEVGGDGNLGDEENRVGLGAGREAERESGEAGETGEKDS
jgi:hypothetical protein